MRDAHAFFRLEQLYAGVCCFPSALEHPLWWLKVLEELRMRWWKWVRREVIDDGAMKQRLFHPMHGRVVRLPRVKPW